MANAVASVGTILSCQPSAAELLDGLILRLAEKSLEYRNYLDFVVGAPESLVLVEFCGDTPGEVQVKADELIEKLRGQPGLFHVLPALEKQMCDHVWACRKAALPLLLGLPDTRKPVAFVEDGAVSPEHLPEFVARFGEIMARHQTDGAFYGHASVGCLHIRPMLDLRVPVDIGRLQAISEEVCALVCEFHGAMSGEHGDGMARSYLNERLFGPRLYEAFKQVKAAFDPHGRLNPGKVVDGPSPVENLRYGAAYRTMEVPTTFDFSREGGFAQAVELCNGAGVCRKLQSGTMCPSFMVTRDEEHSTRGRANALRMVLSGALPPEELTGQRLFQNLRAVPGVQGLQGRVSLERGRGQAQSRISRRLLPQARSAAGGAHDGPRRPVEQARLGAGAAVELAGRYAGRRLVCRALAGSGPTAPVAALRAQPFSQVVSPAIEVRIHARRRTREPGTDRALGRLPDQLLRAGSQPRGCARVASRGLRRSPGRARVLRSNTRVERFSGGRASWHATTSPGCSPGRSGAPRSWAASRVAC